MYIRYVKERTTVDLSLSYMLYYVKFQVNCYLFVGTFISA